MKSSYKKNYFGSILPSSFAFLLDKYPTLSPFHAKSPFRHAIQATIIPLQYHLFQVQGGGLLLQ